MPESPTFTQQMVAKLETLLLANVGLQTVNVDGLQVSYQDLTAQYETWKRKLERENGTRPTLREITMGGV